MALAKTIAIDFVEVENDLYISPITGDFAFGFSDNQHIEDILSSFPGHYKEFPLVGAGIQSLLKAKVNVQLVEGQIKQQLEGDGFKTGRPTVVTSRTQKTIITPRATRVNL